MARSILSTSRRDPSKKGNPRPLFLTLQQRATANTVISLVTRLMNVAGNLVHVYAVEAVRPRTNYTLKRTGTTRSDVGVDVKGVDVNSEVDNKGAVVYWVFASKDVDVYQSFQSLPYMNLMAIVVDDKFLSVHVDGTHVNVNLPGPEILGATGGLFFLTFLPLLPTTFTPLLLYFFWRPIGVRGEAVTARVLPSTLGLAAIDVALNLTGRSQQADPLTIVRDVEEGSVWMTGIELFHRFLVHSCEELGIMPPVSRVFL
ncbi:hypothetical protein Taro_009562 [Colocasia esculenta]|uniref:Uncharacterized protein n=1 Tax=Colocasia esculenta TaxID=4460 RepID=A0A843TWN7_COLES|nr:hypothetical protein [Colocasia esculenta]